MINLLPGETKQQLRAARTNVILIRYMGVIVIAFGFLVLTLFGSYLLLAQTKAGAELIVESNNTDASEYAETQQQITALSSNLSKARVLLDGHISYARVLRALGESMPTGTVIEAIELTPETFTGTTVTLKVYATSTQATVQLRENLQSSATFDNINLASIEEIDGIDGYPTSVTLTMTINRTGSV